MIICITPETQLTGYYVLESNVLELDGLTSLTDLLCDIFYFDN